jgi:signal transduction histidine kinase
MVFSAYEELKIQATEKQLHFTLHLPDDPIEITGDKDKLKEVFLNLVGNAIKFTPVQGMVSIRVFNEKNVIKTAIQDTGPGIRDTDREYLFTKFGKLDFAYSKQTAISGTGLGLYVSKEIVDLHKGNIEVESVVGKGSIFTIVLPKS